MAAGAGGGAASVVVRGPALAAGMSAPRLAYKLCTVCGGIVTDEEEHARAHELLARIRQGIGPAEQVTSSRGGP